MKISELGEFGLIDHLRQLLPNPGEDVVLGIGDDVAVLQTGPNDDQYWLATCDAQIEGSHFVRQAVLPEFLGRKALAINQSDIAAKGGLPRFALVSLGLPEDLDVEFVDELYRGLRIQAQEFGGEIVGGNISSSHLGLIVDIALLGQVPKENLLLRSGAHPGEKVLVTGTLGDAAAGLSLLGNPAQIESEYARTAERRFRLPTPRVRQGQVIGASHLATAMMDISDGLAGDLGHICERSQVGVRVDAVSLPVHPENRRLAHARYRDEWHFALYGGEDYELLFTAPADQAEALAAEIRLQTGTAVSIIGDILPADQGRQLALPQNQTIPLEAKSWDHLRAGRP